MKLLPVMLGAVIGVAVGGIYLTQSLPEDEEWAANSPGNAADWQEHRLLTHTTPTAAPHKFYDTSVLENELALKESSAGVPEALFSDEELAALLEQEQGEVD